MLNQIGLGRNDRVALVLPNGPEMAVAFLSVTAAATCAPLNPAYRTSEFDFYLSDLKAKALLVQKGQDSPAVAAAHQRGIPVIQLSPLPDGEAGLFTLEGATPSHPSLGDPPQPEDVALLLHTSGTTSRPKIVPLTQANLCASAFNICRALALLENDRCLNMQPLFHIHGFMVTLSSLVSGGSVVCADRAEVDRFFVLLDEFRPTWYTAVPAVHQAILARAPLHLGTVQRSRLRFIRSSSSGLPRQVAAELEQVFGAPVLESYGMTEATLQITSNPLPPRVRKFSSVGLSAGPEVAVMDKEGNMLPPGECGEIVIRGASVFTGYEGGPEVNAGAFANGWFRTGDEGFIDADGYVFITGRLKELINRGGEKISPYEVENVLLDHPAVTQAVAFAVPHTKLGEDVAAAVVLRENSSTTEREIREFARGRSAEFKVPRRVMIVDEIPKGPTGKLQRIGLAERLGVTLTRDPASYVPPRETVEHQLVQIWEELLGVSPIGIRDNFFELGGYSLLAAQMLRQVEQVCGRQLPLQALFDGATVEHLAQALVAQQNDESSSSLLVVVQSEGARRPFFFLHGDREGGGFYCLSLARGLGEDQPFYAIAPHGVDGQLVPETIEAMAKDYLEIVRQVQPRGPYLLGGYCNGGVVAYEMARQLLQRGEQVPLLALVASAGWNTRFRALHQGVRGIGYLLGWSSVECARYFRVWRSRLVRLGRLRRERFSERIAFALDLAKRGYRRLARIAGRNGQRDGVADRGGRGATSDEGDDLERVYSKVLGGYMPGRYQGRVTLFWPSSQPTKYPDDPTMGWGKVAAEVEVHTVPGGHASAVATHGKVLADHLRTCLLKVQTD